MYKYSTFCPKVGSRSNKLIDHYNIFHFSEGVTLYRGGLKNLLFNNQLNINMYLRSYFCLFRISGAGP